MLKTKPWFFQEKATFTTSIHNKWNVRVRIVLPSCSATLVVYFFKLFLSCLLIEYWAWSFFSLCLELILAHSFLFLVVLTAFNLVFRLLIDPCSLCSYLLTILRWIRYTFRHSMVYKKVSAVSRSYWSTLFHSW